MLLSVRGCCGQIPEYFHGNEKGSALVIPAGSLNDEPALKPTNNIFWNDRAHWYESGIEAAQCSNFAK